jgi:hypothetical protein
MPFAILSGMIDPTTETLVSFADATKLIPGQPHLSQIYRWAMRGLRGVRLEWIRCGGKRFTSREALQRFYSRLTLADGGESSLATPAVRKRQKQSAERELVQAGFEVGGD